MDIAACLCSDASALFITRLQVQPLPPLSTPAAGVRYSAPRTPYGSRY